LDARCKLGQHFLLDTNLTGRIARLAGDLQGRHVVEVGPGPGGLTRALLDTAAAGVLAVEVDQRAILAIQELAAAYPGRLHVLDADATRLDLAALVPAPRQIAANLPYNIATPLLVGWLRQAAEWERMTLHGGAAAAPAARRLHPRPEGVVRGGRPGAAPGPAACRPVRCHGAADGRRIRSAAQDAARRPARLGRGSIAGTGRHRSGATGGDVDGGGVRPPGAVHIGFACSLYRSSRHPTNSRGAQQSMTLGNNF